MAAERDGGTTPTQDDFVLAIESAPLTEVDVIETDDGSHVDLVVTGVGVDPDTGEAVPVSIALNADDSAYVITIADEEFVVPLDETAEESSHRQGVLIRALRSLQQLAQRVEEETAGMAKRLAQTFTRRETR